MKHDEPKNSVCESINSHQPLTVALTGGIASGKTAVSDYFGAIGIPIIDTDQIAKKIVEPDQPALKSIISLFGREYLLHDGNLNRLKMRDTIYSDRQAKTKLEAILHPLIARQVFARVNELEDSYCILAVPLLVESNFYDWADRVLVVDVPEEVQLNRLVARDNISFEQASAILRSQSSREERLAIADDVIENTGNFSDLRKQVEFLNRKYLRLATICS